MSHQRKSHSFAICSIAINACCISARSRFDHYSGDDRFRSTAKRPQAEFISQTFVPAPCPRPRPKLSCELPAPSSQLPAPSSRHEGQALAMRPLEMASQPLHRQAVFCLGARNASCWANREKTAKSYSAETGSAPMERKTWRVMVCRLARSAVLFGVSMFSAKNTGPSGCSPSPPTSRFFRPSLFWRAASSRGRPH